MIDLIFNVVSTNNRALLAKSLKSIKRSSIPLNYQIWVVDNASYDGSDIMLKESFPDVNVIRNKEVMPAAYNRNLIFNNTKAKFYFILSEDIQLFSDTARIILEIMEKREEIGILGCKTLNEDGTIQNCCYVNYPDLLTESLRILWFPRLLKKYFPEKEWPWDLWPGEQAYEKERTMATVNGCFYLLRGRVLEEIGFMDENYKYCYEDVDFMYRARRKGWLIFYTPQASVIHKSGGWSNKTNLKYRIGLNQQSLYYYILKFYGKRVVSLLWLLRTICSFFMFFPLAILSIFHIPFRGKRVFTLFYDNLLLLYWHLFNIAYLFNILKR